MSLYKYIDFQPSNWGELQGPPVTRLSYRGEVMADTPRLYLRLGERVGPIAYDETGQHNANQEGPVIWDMEGPIAFEDDTAVAFSGSCGFVINETGWLPTGASERTFEFWFKPAGSESVFRTVSYGGSAEGGRYLVTFTADDISVLVGASRYGAQGQSLANHWQHLVVVLPPDATRLDEHEFYLNGQPVSSTVLAGDGSIAINTQDSVLRISQFSGGAANRCDISDIAIYDYALSSQRILKHYQVGTGTEAT